MKKIGYLIKGYKDGLGLSKEFIEKYWSEIEGKSEEIFGKYFKIGNDIDNVVRASNWYKLAYEYLRKEKALCIFRPYKRKGYIEYKVYDVYNESYKLLKKFQ